MPARSEGVNKHGKKYEYDEGCNAGAGAGCEK